VVSGDVEKCGVASVSGVVRVDSVHAVAALIRLNVVRMWSAGVNRRREPRTDRVVRVANVGSQASIPCVGISSAEARVCPTCDCAPISASFE
jgi:hypothetical protein